MIHWQASANEPDGERVVNRSPVMEAWNASGGSAGARSIATIVTSSSGVKMGRWLAGKLMKELGIASCQLPAASYRLTNTTAAAMNTLKYRTISTASSRVPRRIKSGAEM
ncbi:hypothetical protein SODG_005968 [Sodalis praecaptivus]